MEYSKLYHRIEPFQQLFIIFVKSVRKERVFIQPKILLSKLHRKATN